MALHIGIDLDNTIIDYEHVFGPVAAEIGVLEGEQAIGGKETIKARLIAADPSEELWMRVQGQVYGRLIRLARPYEGVRDCLGQLLRAGDRISIVSHKTRYGHFDPGEVDLWQAARAWLAENGFLSGGLGIDAGAVHFEETREAKVQRIRTLGCDIFIDDLLEVLSHPEFPVACSRIWFAANRPREEGIRFELCRNWAEIMDRLKASG